MDGLKLLVEQGVRWLLRLAHFRLDHGRILRVLDEWKMEKDRDEKFRMFRGTAMRLPNFQFILCYFRVERTGWRFAIPGLRFGRRARLVITFSVISCLCSQPMVVKRAVRGREMTLLSS